MFWNRDQILRSIGFQSYAEYLESDKWKSIRKIILRRDGFRCRVCGAPAENVHHRVYSRATLAGQSQGYRHLMSLCRKCHIDAEFSFGVKNSLADANQKLGIGPYMRRCKLCGASKHWKEFRKNTECKECHRQKKKIWKSSVSAKT